MPAEVETIAYYSAMNDHMLRTRHEDRNLERAWFNTAVKDRALEWLLRM